MSTLTKTEHHQCEGIKNDGSRCRKAGTHFWVNGVRLCGVHLNAASDHAERLRDDLARYEEYQRDAFGNIAITLSDDDLAARQRDLAGVEGGEDDTHFRRLRAEHAAVVAEIERRRGREPEPAEGDFL